MATVRNRSVKGAPGRVRIIGGRWKRSVLRFPARPDLRPTPDRVRETLFNWLGADLAGAACLDLFAGSGALGFESASRGASPVVLVESDRAAVQALRANAERLGADQLRLVAGDAYGYLASTNERFDVVFLDPPFRQNAGTYLLGRLPRVLRPGARVYVEALEPVLAEGRWHELKRAKAGQVSYQLLEWSEHDRGSLPGDV